MAAERSGDWLIAAERVFKTSIFAYGFPGGFCGFVRGAGRDLACCFIG